MALTPLLIACARERSWKRRFLLGWAAGFVFWFGVCTWIQFVLEVHGGMGRWGGWGTFVLFALLKGLYMAVFAALAGLVMRAALGHPRRSRRCGRGIERHALGSLGFAWLDLGNAGIDMPLLLRLAPITGVYGLSFVFAMIACAVALVILRRPSEAVGLALATGGCFPLLPALPGPARERARREWCSPISTPKRSGRRSD